MGRASASFQMINESETFSSNRADLLFHRERKGLRSRGDVLFIVMKRVYAHDEKASRCVFANKK